MALSSFFFAPQMKSRAAGIVAAVFASLVLFSQPAAAAPIFFSWGGEKIIKVADFPQTSDFTNNEGKHIDPGVRFKQITIFFIPVWNYDVTWCATIAGDSDHYIDVTHDQLVVAAKSASIQLPNEPQLPFWDAYGGKLLVLLIFGAYAAYRMFSGRKAQPAPPAASQPAPTQDLPPPTPPS